jgi:hypothetical protein
LLDTEFYMDLYLFDRHWIALINIAIIFWYGNLRVLIKEHGWKLVQSESTDDDPHLKKNKLKYIVLTF